MKERDAIWFVLVIVVVWFAFQIMVGDGMMDYMMGYGWGWMPLGGIIFLIVIVGIYPVFVVLEPYGGRTIGRYYPVLDRAQKILEAIFLGESILVLRKHFAYVNETGLVDYTRQVHLRRRRHPRSSS